MTDQTAERADRTDQPTGPGPDPTDAGQQPIEQPVEEQDALVEAPRTDDIPGALEALLLLAEEPMSETVLAQAVGAPVHVVAEALTELVAFYDETGRGFELRQLGGGWRYYTRAEHADLIAGHVLDGAQSRLSQAALETLSVIAYLQPISRSRVSAIRGVNVDGVIRTLLARGLIVEAGADAETGAVVFSTTDYFLERMGLTSLDQLPELAPHLPEASELEAELSQFATITPAAGAEPADAAPDRGPDLIESAPDGSPTGGSTPDDAPAGDPANAPDGPSLSPLSAGSPASPKSAASPDSPVSGSSPGSPGSASSPGSPGSASSPGSPDSGSSPGSPDSGSSPGSPTSPKSPDLPDPRDPEPVGPDREHAGDPAPEVSVPAAPTPGDPATAAPAPGDPTPADPGPGDSAPGDIALVDPGPGDSAPGDSAPGDIAPADPGPGDSAPGDSAPGDIAPADHGPGDSAPGDSALGDIAPPADPGPGAPAPGDSAPGDPEPANPASQHPTPDRPGDHTAGQAARDE